MKKPVLLKIALGAVLLGLINYSVFAQFQVAYSTTGIEGGKSVQLSFDKNYVIAGNTQSLIGPSINPGDATVLKVNKDGGLLWSNIYGGKGNDYLNAIRQITFDNIDGGFVAAGSTFSYGFGKEDVYLIRIKPEFGAMPWSRSYGGEGYDRGNSLQVLTPECKGCYSNYVIAGESSSFRNGDMDMYIIKTDPYGALLSSTVIGGNGDDGANWIEQTQDNGFIVVGYTKSFQACPTSSIIPNKDIYIVKLNKDLKIEWTRVIGGVKDEEATAVKQTSFGEFIISGVTQSFGVYANDAFLLRINSVGDFVWMKTYGDKLNQKAYSILLDIGFIEQENFVISGTTNDPITSGATEVNDVLQFKTTFDGTLLWAKRYGSSKNDLGYENSYNPDGGYVITGQTASFSVSGDPDIYLIETDVSGKSDCKLENNLVFKELKQSPCITKGGDQKFIKNEIVNNDNWKAYKYQTLFCPYDKVTESSESKLIQSLEEGKGLKISPNPTFTSIELNLENSFVGEIQILDLKGRAVKKWSIKTLQKNIPLNTEDLRQGVYLISLTNELGENKKARFIKN